MQYSQKYTLVQFLEPQTNGTRFSMEEWPIHVTLADTFAIDLSDSLIQELHAMLSQQKSHHITASDDLRFGTEGNPLIVVGFEKSIELQTLHAALIDFLEKQGAAFNSPEFTQDGFIAHSTIQNGSRIDKGDSLHIGSLSLIDMFVDGDWRSRKVLDTFNLSKG